MVLLHVLPSVHARQGALVWLDGGPVARVPRHVRVDDLVGQALLALDVARRRLVPVILLEVLRVDALPAALEDVALGKRRLPL
eukprot:5050929-Pyramimonas_sp.AAC.1